MNSNTVDTEFGRQPGYPLQVLASSLCRKLHSYMLWAFHCYPCRKVTAMHSVQFCIALLYFVFSTAVFAQEKVSSIQHLYGTQQSSSFYKKTRGLALPFYDDFSQNSSTPNPLKWQDNLVHINNTKALGAPTKGVASFDAINSQGLFYPAAYTTALFKADSLTSQEISLGAYTAANNIFMSFQVQPQGLAFRPEPNDSLKLFFLDKNNVWQKVWAKDGSAAYSFYTVLLPITDTTFLHDNFQFRFVNWASPNTNDDVWHIDAVYINTNRSNSDSLLKDIAFTTPPTNLLDEYSSMPYRHFIADTTRELSTSFSAAIKNNYLVANTVGVNFTSRVVNTPILLKSSFVNVTTLANAENNAFFSKYNIGYTPADINSDVTIRHLFYYNRLNASDITSNDTIVHDQIFSNYFAYDDGSAEKSYFLLSLANTPASTAMKFHLNVSDTIRGLAIHFENQTPTGNGKTFDIELYSNIGTSTSSQQLIYRKKNNIVSYTNTIDGFSNYSLDSLIVLPPGDYYIGTTQQPNIGADSIYFGLDANTVGNLDHFFYNVDGNWIPSTVPASVMMRPLMSKNFVPTSITNTTQQKQNIAVYPNPCTTHLSLETNQPIHSYIIFNTQGSIVQQGKTQKTIDVQSLPCGQYYIQINQYQILSFSKQ
jgi:hypothetical protein